MTDEPTTPAGLPRNREADHWRTRYVAAANVAAFLCGALLAAVAHIMVAHSQRDAARAQVDAAEAARGEGGGGRGTHAMPHAGRPVHR